MSTIFDVPMHDFSGEGSMDTDMLPMSTQDADWLQVENMIEDDVSKQLEVEMIQETGVQEFEMVDTGDTDIPDYVDNAAPAEQFALEVLDQEIPDASRATSPTPIIRSIDHDAHTVDVSIVPEADEGLREIDTVNQYEEPESVHEELLNVYSNDVEHHAHDSHDASDQHDALPSQTEAAMVDHASKEEIFDPTEEHDLQQIEHTEDHDEGSTAHSTEAAVTVTLPEDAYQEAVATSLLIDESQAHNEEYDASLEKVAVQEVSDSSLSTQYKAASSDHPQQPTSLPAEAPLNTHLEEQFEYTASSSHNLDEEEKDGEGGDSLLGPPPCVLLTYLFDGSQYYLFQNPEKGRAAESSDTASKPSETPASESQNPSDKTVSQNIQSELRPARLFAEQSDLFYAPLSQVFQAIRNDPSVNLGGRFDENVELVITAVGLDLRLPEDNIHSREVSLNDLSVLHTGCELIGPLSLQLDTIAPRFGTRYKAIRDALVSIVSNADDHEHDSEQVPYTEGQEDLDAHQSTSTVQEEPTVPPSPSQKINDGSYAKTIDANNTDTTEGTKEVTDDRNSIKPEDGREDEEAENSHENENENEGIGHVEHTEPPSEPHAKPDDVQDDSFDEDADGEYEEEGQSYDGTYGDIDTLYYSENQEASTLLEENPQVEENDIQNPESETLDTAVEHSQYLLLEGPIQDGLTPEQDSTGSEEGSLYEASAHEKGVDTNAPRGDDLSSIQNVASPRVPSSKRSFDEHENGQYEEDGGSPSSAGGATQKRLRRD